MMDTILNLGLNDDAVEGLAASDRQPALRLRLVPPADPDVRRGRRRASTRTASSRRSTDLKAERGVQQDVELDGGRPARARRHVQAALRARRPGSPFPQDAREQLRAAVQRRLRLVGHAARAGLPPRARHPRRPRHGGQRRQMVFGNKGESSGTGVCFTRDPSTGEHGLYGEFLAERPGRGRRRRHPHAASRSRAMQRAAAGGATTSCSTTIAPARGALPRHAGHRVHGRGGPALPAADAHGEAHGRRRAARRRSTWSDEGLITREEAVAADRPGAARPAAASDASTRRAQLEVAARGLNASPGAAVRRGRLRRRHRRGARQGRRER